MKKIFWVIVVLSTSIALFSEEPINKQIEELEKKLSEVSGVRKVDTLNDLAEKIYSISPKKCIEYAQRALTLSQKLNYKKGEGRAFHYSGNGYLLLGDYKKALKYYHQSLRIRAETGDRKGKADSLNTIGAVHYYLGNHQQALKHYQKSLKIREEIVDKIGIASCLSNIGVIYESLSSYEKALGYYEKSIKIQKEIGDKKGMAKCLNNMGIVNRGLSNYEKALEYYLKSLKINQEIGNKQGIANLYCNIGPIYRDLGNYDKALEYDRKALKLQKEIGDKKGLAISLSNLGSFFMRSGDFTKAIEYYHKALGVDEEIGFKRGIAASNMVIGHFYVERCNFKKAMHYFNEALNTVQKIGNRSGIASCLTNIGNLLGKQKNYSDSDKILKRSLGIAKEIGDPKRLLEVQFCLASNFYHQQKYKKAAIHFKKAAGILEQTRKNLCLEEHKSGFFKTKVIVYEELIKSLFGMHREEPQKGYDREGFFYCEKAKARAFLEMLVESKIHIKILDPELRNKRKTIQRKISQINTKIQKTGLSLEQRKTLSGELKRLYNETDKLRFEIKRTNPQYFSLVFPESYNLAQVQNKLLNRKTAIIEFFSGDNHLFVFLIKKGDFASHQLPFSEKYEKSIKLYSGILSSKQKRFEDIEVSKRFYNELIRPFEEKIKDIKNLIIIPDGALCYMPFETLISENSEGKIKYLVEDFTITYAPSASSLGNLVANRSKHKSRKDLLAIGDPVYRKDNIPQNIYNSVFRDYYQNLRRFEWQNLYYSREEVMGISTCFKKDTQDIYLKKEATEDIFKKLPLNRYKIIHLAMHGLVDEKNPLRSALVFSLDKDTREDGFLQAYEIYDMKMDADLVVLSACHTGQGKIERGEGVLGLTRAFFYAGARSVLSTLWKIDDKASSYFMKSFYTYLSQGMSKADALRYTKLKMIESKYRHPFYWAGFIISGDCFNKIFMNK